MLGKLVKDVNGQRTQRSFPQVIKGRITIPPDMVEVLGIRAERPVIAFLLEDDTILLPFYRRDGEITAAEFGAVNIVDHKTVNIGVFVSEGED